MNNKTRIAWHIGFLLFAPIVYFTFADGNGRLDWLVKWMLVFWPAIAVADVIWNWRRSK